MIDECVNCPYFDVKVFTFSDGHGRLIDWCNFFGCRTELIKDSCDKIEEKEKGLTK